MNKTGLGLKILVGLALISFIAMSSLILVLRIYLGKTLETQLVKRAVTIAHFLSDSSVNPILTHKQLALDLMLHEHRKNDSDLAYIFIADPKREILSHTFEDGFPTGLKELNGVGQQGESINQIRFGDQDIVDISVPVMGNNLGRLHVGMSLNGIRKEIRVLLFTASCFIASFFLIAAIFMWLFLERLAVKPIKELGQQIRLMGHGNFEAQTVIHSEDEIGVLGKAFNEMGRHLNELYTQMSERSAELVLLNEQLEQLATTDGLTGLFNHRHFYGRLTEEVRRAKRYQHPLSLILADIDLFKQFNDTYGHVAGDKVLKKIAGVISENARENDLTARYGGEEFAIILPETNMTIARLVAERMRLFIESSPALIEMTGKPVTMSFGVAQLDEATDNPESFVCLADAMLYQAKQNGRNRVECVEC